MKAYKYVGKYSNFKYTVLSFLRVNKVRIFVLCFFTILGLLTGIFTAVKYLNGTELFNFNNYGITQFANGNIATTELFFKRFLSYTCFLFILLICSLSAFLLPIGCFVIVYRSYLLGLNITIIVVLYGFGGILSAIVIILPIQLCMLVFACLFYCMVRNRCIIKKKYGKAVGLNTILLFLIFLVLLSILNLLETILLILFSGQVILII